MYRDKKASLTDSPGANGIVGKFLVLLAGYGEPLGWVII